MVSRILCRDFVGFILYKIKKILLMLNLKCTYNSIHQITSFQILLCIILHKNWKKKYIKPPEDDQSIPIETSSWNQRFFSEPPQLIRDSHYMVLPQTFPYRNSSMQSFKSYLHKTCIFQFLFESCKKLDLREM